MRIFKYILFIIAFGFVIWLFAQQLERIRPENEDTPIIERAKARNNTPPVQIPDMPDAKG